MLQGLDDCSDDVVADCETPGEHVDVIEENKVCPSSSITLFFFFFLTAAFF